MNTTKIHDGFYEPYLRRQCADLADEIQKLTSQDIKITYRYGIFTGCRIYIKSKIPDNEEHLIYSRVHK